MINPIVPLIVVIPLMLLILGGYTYGVVKNKNDIFLKILKIARVFVVMAMVFLINLRIMGKRYNVDVEMKNIDVLFVVDTTISMWAEDSNGNEPRMNAVLRDCELWTAFREVTSHL